MRFLPFAFTLALATPLAWSATPCIDVCKTLVDEGNVLSTKGASRQALDKYKAAMRAAPEATLPLVSAAFMVLDWSWSADATQAGKMRSMAEAMARQALQFDADNAMAQDILRQVRDGQDAALHKPNAAAEEALQQAETLFAQHRYDDARKQYETAMARDPLWSQAAVGAGDCYFMQQDWPRAEALFLRATAIEPRNDQAWRFLSDSLAKQGKMGAAEQALYSALAANPAERNTWSHLAGLRARAQLPLASLHLTRGSHLTVGADGKYTLNIDQTGVRKDSPPDMAFALALGVAESNLRIADASKTAYEIELASWRAAFTMTDEATAKSGKALTDPAILKMQAMHRDGQLEPALLLLAYRPSYRPAYDAWLAAHPGGVKAFIDRYGLQP
jgi:tetratricopeptide (TPR) repeat protein